MTAPSRKTSKQNNYFGNFQNWSHLLAEISNLAYIMSNQERVIHQPLHPDVRPKLDPEYIAFHDKYMQYVQRDESKVWDSSARTTPSLPPGGSAHVQVGSIEDVQLPDFAVRVFTPEGEHQGGWPGLIWFHGGGWAIGGLNDNKDFCTLMCKGRWILFNMTG
jgi:acetyl esterase/lipase